MYLTVRLILLALSQYSRTRVSVTQQKKRITEGIHDQADSMPQYRPLEADIEDCSPNQYSTQKADASAYTSGLIDTYNKKSIVPPNSGFSSALKVYKSQPVITQAPRETLLKFGTTSARKKGTLPIPDGQTKLPFSSTSIARPSKVIGRTLSVQEQGVTDGCFTYQSTSNPSIDPSSEFAAFAQLVNSALKVPDLASCSRYPNVQATVKSSTIMSTSGGKTSGQGSLQMPETRQSVISDAVLLHPIPSDGVKPSLAGFQGRAAKGLEMMKNLGEPDVIEERGDIEEVGSTSARTRGVIKRASQGLGVGASDIKKARK